MSDFIFSSEKRKDEVLSGSLLSIYDSGVVGVKEYHGGWGSLAFTDSKYYGFEPFETEDYICIVIGGPLLCFDYSYEKGADYFTRAIFERWMSHVARWDEDLSGPFVVFILDKKKNKIHIVTDMMMFIPTYFYKSSNEVVIGTHVDVVAKACSKEKDFDDVSLIDFVLNNIVTHPFTAYNDIYQCEPGAIYCYDLSDYASNAEIINYWFPEEKVIFEDLGSAAVYLNKGIVDYIEKICVGSEKVAHFISAGEDSRVLAGLLPEKIKRDAYIFVDNMNREGRIAKKVADAYGANFQPSFRSESHYIEILEEASMLTGIGHQYSHAHTLGFHEKFSLDKYPAVFGGYLSDSLLKGQFSKQSEYRNKFPFLPQRVLEGEERTLRIENSLFPIEKLDKLRGRRIRHYNKVASLRPTTAHEWFELWPATMRTGMPNLYVNRRLFASYEIFMTKQAVKVASGVPLEWKLNRRLFHFAFKVALIKSKFLFHADGRLPFFSWRVNLPVQLLICSGRGLYKKFGFPVYHEGPWGSWGAVAVSKSWKEYSEMFYSAKGIPEVLSLALKSNIFDMDNDELNIIQKSNLMQVCFTTSSIKS